MEFTSVSAVVAHVSADVPVFPVSPLLNSRQLANMDDALLTCEREGTVWLNTLQPKNITDVFWSCVAFISHNIGFPPVSPVSPLLNLTAFININDAVVQLVGLVNTNVWLKFAHSRNILNVVMSAVASNVSAVLPLLKAVAVLNMRAIVVTLDVSHALRFRLKRLQLSKSDVMSVTALTSHAPMFDVAPVREVHPLKQRERDVVVGRSGEPVDAEMSRLAQPEK